MMKLYQKLVGIFCAAAIVLPLAGCDGETSYAGGADKNVKDTAMVTDKLTRSQQTPVDIEYSMERYNLIRRAYWVNGQREKADSLPCPVESRWDMWCCLPGMQQWGGLRWMEKYPA